jgi:excinuclease ABC subunit C
MAYGKLTRIIKGLPDSPGVYQFLDKNGCVIYVGKALRLKRRVASYFQTGRARDNRLELLAGEVRDIRVVRASSEAEALIYEAGLIKAHSPKFNVELKDDKSYPFLKLTVNEKYPRLFITRRRINDGAAYYGPYVNVKLLRDALAFMKKLFPLKSCRNFHKNICLEYHMGQCQGPCSGRISPEEYDDIVLELRKFLEGRKDDLMDALETRMKKFSAGTEYEKALEMKKRIEALTAVRSLHDTARKPLYGELDELQQTLGLATLPMTIECFDISNTSGMQAVGSMVRFVAGRPQKAAYRRYRIKGVSRVDDYSMIREVLRRRYSRIAAEGGAIPDVILIDGGKGHLSVAENELKAVGSSVRGLASIAKDSNNIYVAGRRHPVRLPPGSRLLLLIQRVRDEAHRFAIAYHRKLRSKDKFKTGLRKIKGVGPARERTLLARFGTPAEVGKASEEELIRAGIDRRTVAAIMAHRERLAQ